jgi:hypothetical protein
MKRSFWVGVSILLGAFPLFSQKGVDTLPQRLNRSEETIPEPPGAIGAEYPCVYQKSRRTRQTTVPFNQADTIKVFSYPEPGSEIQEDGTQTTPKRKPIVLVKKAVRVSEIKEVVRLTDAQKDSLFALFYDWKSPKGTDRGAACYQPRHCIIFYKKQRVVAFFEICLTCHQVNHTPKVDFGELCGDKFNQFRTFFYQIGIRYGLESEPYQENEESEKEAK